MFGIRGNALPITNIRNYNMIDYIKILLINIDIKHLESKLEFETSYIEKTGELSIKKVAEYNFCKITIYETGLVFFTGSIHKFYNELKGIKAPKYKLEQKYRGFNGNQFTVNDIYEVKIHLEKLFDCKPYQMIFQNIEFGVNITPSFNPIQYLKGLLYHRNILFEFMYNGNFSQVPHQRYIIKIYNKSSQYKMCEYTLRIELKIIKSEELKKLEIETFADINELTLNKAKDLLLKRFDEVMHYDYTISKKDLSMHQKQSLKNYSNPRYWIVDLNPKHRDRHKKRLKEIILNNSDNLHQQLRQNIIKKCVIINRISEIPKCVIINSSNIELINTQKPLIKTGRTKLILFASFYLTTFDYKYKYLKL